MDNRLGVHLSELYRHNLKWDDAGDVFEKALHKLLVTKIEQELASYVADKSAKQIVPMYQELVKFNRERRDEHKAQNGTPGDADRLGNSREGGTHGVDTGSHSQSVRHKRKKL